MQLHLPSPVVPIHDPLFKAKGLEVFIKRDDLIHPQISGNKWRKLKYILQKAKNENKNHLITFGGAFSNHLLATAAAAHWNGFNATGIVRGDEVNNEILKQCKAFGMDLQFVDRESYRDKQSLFDRYLKHEPNTYFIDEGGASAEAVLGCAELIDELSEVYDHIFCAAGTGTTAAGIYQGIKNKDLNTQIAVIAALKGGEFLTREVEKYTEIDHRFRMHTDYHFGGYAKTNTELLKFIINFHDQSGILLDPVYTGKTLFAMYDLIQKNQFKPGSKILAIHTGGLLGLLGMEKKFLAISPDFRQVFDTLLKK